MRKTNKAPNSFEPVLIDTDGLKGMCGGVGRHTAVKIGTAAGARVKIGARVLWNTKKLKEYLETIKEG